MAPRMCYVAYPIDLASLLAQDVALIENSEELLIAGGIDIVFDPGDAFQVAKGAEVGDEVARINRIAANTADSMLAFLPKGVATVGVPMEIDRSVRQGKPTAVVTDNNRSWMLSWGGNRNHRFFPWSQDGVAEAVRWLCQQERVPGATADYRTEYLPVVPDHPQFMPTRAFDDDAGLDLYVAEDVTIDPGQFVDVPCGVSVELPSWSWGMLTGRSSTLRRRGLLVNTGVIDCGYRGPLFAGVFNISNLPVQLRRGDRVAQLIILGNGTSGVQPLQVASLAEHPRGGQGFGSSGR